MHATRTSNPAGVKAGFRPPHLLAAAAILASVSCTTLPPGVTPLASTASVPAPKVAAGDTWTYRVRDGYTGLERGSQSYRVTEAGANRLVVAVSGANVAGEEVHVYDGEWGWLSRPATNLQSFTYNPSYQAFAFPLVPGKTWRERLSATDPADKRSFPVWLDANVTGWERVKVAAGEFDAIRVRRFVVISYWELGVRGHSEISEEEWYAPAVKQVVRREARSQHRRFIGSADGPFLQVRDRSDGDGPQMVRDDWFVWELTSYSVR